MPKNMLVKEILRPGQFIDFEGQPVTITGDDIGEFVRGTESLRLTGFKVQAFPTHLTDDSNSIMGTWVEFFEKEVDGKPRAFGVFDPMPRFETPEEIERLKRLDVSAVLQEQFDNGEFKAPKVITRVDVVGSGAIPGMAPFKEQSLSVRTSYLSVPGLSPFDTLKSGKGKVQMATAVGSRIRSLRESKGWSIEDLAQRVSSQVSGEFSESAVGDIETGDINQPSEEALRGFAKALDVSFESLDSLVKEAGQSEGGRFQDPSTNPKEENGMAIKLADIMPALKEAAGMQEKSDEEMMSRLQEFFIAESDEKEGEENGMANGEMDEEKKEMTARLSAYEERIKALEKKEIENAVDAKVSMLSAPLPKDKVDSITANYDALRAQGVKHDLAMKIANDHLDALSSQKSISLSSAITTPRPSKNGKQQQQNPLIQSAIRAGLKQKEN